MLHKHLTFAGRVWLAFLAAFLNMDLEDRFLVKGEIFPHILVVWKLYTFLLILALVVSPAFWTITLKIEEKNLLFCIWISLSHIIYAFWPLIKFVFGLSRFLLHVLMRNLWLLSFIYCFFLERKKNHIHSSFCLFSNYFPFFVMAGFLDQS